MSFLSIPASRPTWPSFVNRATVVLDRICGCAYTDAQIFVETSDVGFPWDDGNSIVDSIDWHDQFYHPQHTDTDLTKEVAAPCRRTKTTIPKRTASPSSVIVLHASKKTPSLTLSPRRTTDSATVTTAASSSAEDDREDVRRTPSEISVPYRAVRRWSSASQEHDPVACFDEAPALWDAPVDLRKVQSAGRRALPRLHGYDG